MTEIEEEHGKAVQPDRMWSDRTEEKRSAENDEKLNERQRTNGARKKAVPASLEEKEEEEEVEWGKGERKTKIKKKN